MKRARGFTLIEMLVTLTLIAILASVVAPLAQVSAQRSKEQDLKLALRDIRAAIDAYKQAADEGRIYRSADDSGYPPDLQALVDGVPDLKDPRGRKLYFLRRIPADPMTDNGTEPAAGTWDQRAYDSEPDAPHPGRDVYDVRSRSPGTGLNGRPYREW